MRSVIVYIVLLTASLSSIAQPKVFVTHIGTEDGLPQKTVVNMVQDRRGFMWFSTWNGICKYDGANFYSYKVKREDSQALHSDRFDGMWLDKYGYIWASTYESEVYRFDPRTERFMSLRSINKFKRLNFETQNFIVTPSGKKWLINRAAGAFCFKDSAFTPLLISKQTGLLQSNYIHSVYEDNSGKSWVLTKAGVYCFSVQLQKLQSFFTGKNARPIFRALEVGSDIWFSTDSGKIITYNPAKKTFGSFQTPGISPVKRLLKINENLTLLGTEDNDFFIYDKKQHRLQKYQITQVHSTPFTEIISYYPDRSGNIWVQTKGAGVYKLSTITGQFKHFAAVGGIGPKDQFAPGFKIWEDVNNRLWIQPVDGGLTLYDNTTDELKPFQFPLANGLSTTLLLHTGFSDKQGNLWVSTRRHGLNKIQFGNAGVTTQTVDPGIAYDQNHEVRSIMEDHTGRLWVGVKGGKIYVYNTQRQRLGFLTKNGKIGNSEPIDGMAYSIIEDKNYRIWIGTKGKGLYCLLPGHSNERYDVKNYKYERNNIYSLSDDRVYSVFADKNNRIWVATFGGGLNLLDDRKDGHFYNSRNQLTGYPGKMRATGYRARHVSADSYGNIYVGTASGLFVAKPNYTHVSGMVFKYMARSPVAGSLSGNDVYQIYTTRNGDTYIACFGGGLNKVIARDLDGIPTKFKNYQSKSKLATSLAQQIVEDSFGKLWIATESSVCRFDPKRESFETYQDINRLLQGSIVSESASARLRNGMILVGHANGLLNINPALLVPDTFKPYVALTNFKIANKALPVEDATILKQNIDYVSQIRLNHRQNFISFEFAALDMKNTGQISYAYKLDGIDTGWVYTNQRDASYSNLAPGKYTFRVRSNNGFGFWQNNEHHIDVEISPAWWQTYWAVAAYIIFTAVLIFVGVRWVYRYFRLKDRLLLEQEQMEMRANFFTEISHEIRTPLTMIVSPLEGLLEQDAVDPTVKENLKLMHKNAARMLRLVNQVLDFRKIENQILIVTGHDLSNLMNDVAATFNHIAVEKKINIKVNTISETNIVWADRESLEKLAYNLLSNAVKNTAAGDSVTINISLQHDELVLRIADTGRGMSNDLLKKLFVRFMSQNNNKSQPSTGIGLSIVKEIVDRHHARINVESKENAGSTFTIYFQTGNKHFENDANVVIQKTESQLPQLVHFDEFPNTGLADADLNNTSILVLEDDNDLRNYIVSLLRPDCQVIQAAEGEEGFAKAQTEMPDFILSDLMMAGMDGFTFLKKLRSTQATSHIPVVFITAKTDQDTEMLAYELGADAFITKPFSIKVLKTRIRNILEQRKRLAGLITYNPNEQTETPVIQAARPPKLTRLDEQFIKKVRADIELNMARTDYTVEDLIGIMPMSRTVFVKKLKSLTGHSPIEFIRQMKMFHAASLIEAEDYSIKEISHMVGIGDTKYFSQRFKEVMGAMPSEYKNRLKKIINEE